MWGLLGASMTCWRLIGGFAAFFEAVANNSAPTNRTRRPYNGTPEGESERARER